MSGSVLAPWASQQKPRDNARILAKNLSCPIGDSMEMIICMKEIPVQLMKLPRGC